MTLRPWLFFAVACTAAVGRVAFSRSTPDALPADAALKRGAFVDVQTHTAEMRRVAAKDFPTDRWSQDDSFHEQERTRAKNYAAVHRITVQDALDGIDQGIRDRGAHGGDPTAATVPPCRPRAIY